MYAKLIVALCAVGVARAGGLYGAAPIAYSAIAAPAVVTKTITPAVSSISSYSTQQTHGSPITTYAAAPIIAKTIAAPALATYTAPAVSSYAAAPAVITKTIAPAVSSISSYSTDIAHGSPVATYAAAPVLAKAAYAAPAYAAPAYAAPAYAGYAAPIAYAAPAVAAYSAPLITKTYAAAPIAAYAATAPILKSAVSYSAGPVAYNALGANYGW